MPRTEGIATRAEQSVRALLRTKQWPAVALCLGVEVIAVVIHFIRQSTPPIPVRKNRDHVERHSHRIDAARYDGAHGHHLTICTPIDHKPSIPACVKRQAQHVINYRKIDGGGGDGDDDD